MKKLLNRIPLKTIFWFYSITSLYSISWVYFFRPTQANYEHFISYLSSAFNIYNFNLYSAVYFLRDIRIISFDLYANSFLHIEAMFPLLILAASLIFFFSKFKDTRMLRYLLSIAIALMLMGFINGFVYRILVFDKLPLSSLLLFLFFRIIDVFIILCHYHVITRLNSEDELRHTSISEGDETLVLASRGQRFMNYFIDCFPRILVSLILASFMMSLARMSILSGNLDSSFEEYAFRYLLLFIGVIIVYFLLERLFLRSPAKFITNTQVIVKKGNHKTSSIVKRTLTRLIPVIDLFSFAFSEKGDGLHDEWSDTLVVKNKPKGIAYGWYFVIFPLVMFLPFTPSIIKNEINQMRYREVSTTYEENKKNRALDHQQLAYFVKGEFFEIDQGYRSSYGYLYIVDSTDTNNIYASKLIEKREYEKFNPEAYSLEDYYRDYKDELEKIVFDKNNLKYPLKLTNPKHISVSDVYLRKHSWSYNSAGESVNSYRLEIEINDRSSCSIKAFKIIEGDLVLKKDASSPNSVNLKIDTEKKKLENKVYIVEVKLMNRTSNNTAKYHIKFTKYGVLDFYEVKS